MKKIILSTVIAGVALLFSGCSATVPMEPKELSREAKLFSPPSEGNAGIYIYRDSVIGSALKKDLFIDGEYIGSSAPNVFFYEEVEGDKEHEVSTESEFSDNTLTIATQKGKLYFLRQYIKLGVFVGGANLEEIDEQKAKKAIKKLDLAKSLRGTK